MEANMRVKSHYMIFALFMLTVSIPTVIKANVKMSQIVSLDEQTNLMKDEMFDRYITRDNFCSLDLQDLLFTESIPGKFMLDLTVNFGPKSSKKPLRILFNDLIEIKNPGEPISLKLSNTSLAQNINLSGTTDIDISLRLVPVTDGRYDQIYSTILPLLNVPSYLPEVGKVLDNFIQFSSSSDNRTSLLFHANVPVAQSIIEAQKIAQHREPLLNGFAYAIAIEGSRQITDQSLIGKSKDFLRGAAQVVSGHDVIWNNLLGISVLIRPESKFKGFVRLVFHKATTPPIPVSLSQQLTELAELSEEVTTDYELNQLKLKAQEVLKVIDMVANTNQIDCRSKFHLKNQVALTRAWGYYKLASQGGNKELKDSDNWKIEFENWFQMLDYEGQSQDTQAYGISKLYSGHKVAKIFVPYSLSDLMTLKTIRWQVILNKTLQMRGDQSLAVDNS